MTINQVLTVLIFVASFALVSFAAALIFYDRSRKLARLRREDKEHAIAYAVDLRHAIEARDSMLAHWCNECIQLQRRLDLEHSERRRWERAYTEKLPRSYS